MPEPIAIVQTPPALLRSGDAASYLGIGETLFAELVAQDVLPKPRQIGKRSARWLRVELDAAVMALPVASMLPVRRGTQQP